MICCATIATRDGMVELDQKKRKKEEFAGVKKKRKRRVIDEEDEGETKKLTVDRMRLISYYDIATPWKKSVVKPLVLIKLAFSIYTT